MVVARPMLIVLSRVRFATTAAASQVRTVRVPRMPIVHRERGACYNLKTARRVCGTLCQSSDQCANHESCQQATVCVPNQCQTPNQACDAHGTGDGLCVNVSAAMSASKVPRMVLAASPSVPPLAAMVKSVSLSAQPVPTPIVDPLRMFRAGLRAKRAC